MSPEGLRRGTYGVIRTSPGPPIRWGPSLFVQAALFARFGRTFNCRIFCGIHGSGEPIMPFVRSLGIALLSLMIVVSSAYAEKRVALVVGNDRYPNLSAERQLQRAVTDARAIG